VENPDTAQLNLRLDSGASAQVSLSRVDPNGFASHSFTCIGDDGSIVYSLGSPTAVAINRYGCHSSETIPVPEAGGDQMEVFVKICAAEIADFAALKTGDVHSDLPLLVDGHVVQQVLAAVGSSMTSGCEVEVAY
jgi:predicted dehydrogenase